MKVPGRTVVDAAGTGFQDTRCLLQEEDAEGAVDDQVLDVNPEDYLQLMPLREPS
jgi:hypothetical protein